VSGLAGATRPRLARGVRLRLDHVSGKYLLLRPERGFELVGSALAIVRLFAASPTAPTAPTIDGIIDSLAGTHEGTPRAEIAADVLRLLDELAARGLIEVEES
jgi:pyrroloquinoline quinone biosynthesis protein D